MSGVYINIEIPKNGSCIQIVIDDDGKVYPSVEKCILKMGSIAKAVPIPVHGRLIDADALMKRMWEETDCMVSVPATFVRDAPAIIPAEEGE